MIVGAGPGLGQGSGPGVRASRPPDCPLCAPARATGYLGRRAARREPSRLGLRRRCDQRWQAARGDRASRGRAGPPSVLVYNAFVLQADRPRELSARALSDVLAVDVSGAVTAVNSFLPLLGDSGGTVLLTGGGLALQPSAQLASLSIGKAALRAYAQVLHEDQAERGVHVSTITITRGSCNWATNASTLTRLPKRSSLFTDASPTSGSRKSSTARRSTA